MIDLLTLEPQKISKTLKGKSALIYGSAGVGKTTLASKFEKSLILAFELGTNALNDIYVAPMQTWKDFKDIVKQLTKKLELQNKFFNICIDTCDEAYKLCEKYVCNKYGVETIKEVSGYGGGYKILDEEFMTPFRDLSYMGYGLLFISHETEKPFTDEKGQEYTKIVPALPNRPFNLINKMVDVISYIREIPVSAEPDSPRERFMFFRGNEKILTKSRFKYIIPKIPLDYQTYVDAIYDAIDKEIAETGGGTANSEAVDNYSFDSLMEDAKALWIKAVNSGKNQEVLNILETEFGKPTKFSEILPEQTKQLVSALQTIREIL